MSRFALDRRTLLSYAVGIDLVLIAAGLALLLPPASVLVLVPFLAAAALAASRGGWRVGLATTVVSATVLVSAFEALPLIQVGVFFVVSAAVAIVLDGRLFERADEAPLRAMENQRFRTQVTEAGERVRAFLVPALSDVGLPLLVLLVYLNVSTVLVADFGIASILQPVILVAAALVFHYRDSFRPLAALVEPMTVSLLVYLLIAIASSNWAHDLAAADTELSELVKSLLLLVVVASLATSWRSLRRTLIALVCGAVLLSTLTLAQVAIGNPELQFGGFAGLDEGHIYGEVNEPRPAGPVGDPNYFARILILAFPAAVFAGIGSRRFVVESRYALAAGVIGLATLFTYSRGGMVTLAVVTCLLVAVKRIPLNWMTATAAAIVVLALLPTNVGQRLLTIEALFQHGSPVSTGVDPSVEKRQHLLAAAFRIFEDNPILGVGVGNFGDRYPRYAKIVGLSAIDFTPIGLRQYPHNLYLELATETGLLGLVSFLVAMFVTLVSLLRARRSLEMRGEDVNAGTITAITLSIVGYLFASLFLHSGMPRYLWLVLGLAVAALRLSRRPVIEAHP
jgi:O-antigen ligase